MSLFTILLLIRKKTRSQKTLQNSDGSCPKTGPTNPSTCQNPIRQTCEIKKHWQSAEIVDQVICISTLL